MSGSVYSAVEGDSVSDSVKETTSWLSLFATVSILLVVMLLIQMPR